MLPIVRLATAVALGLAIISPQIVIAAPLTAGLAQVSQDEPAMVERQHQIHAGGRSLAYVSRAGRLPIVDDQTGAVQAWISFSAYTVARKPGQPRRPLTFIWNGGPGSASALVHLAGFGPRRIIVPDNPPLGGQGDTPVGVIDNADTWLCASDLVFVDPVGTGFSRAVSAAIEPKFLNTLGDAESIAEFIRVYHDRFGVWDQPIIQGGESYGVTRAAWVAEALLRRRLPLSGVLLITWDIPLGDLPSAERHALALPTYTAAARYHKRLAPDLMVDFDRTIDEVTRWSQGPYIDAVRRHDTLDDVERAGIVAQLARYIGLRPSQIDARTLNVDTGYYSETLLRDHQLVIGRYDRRFVTTTVGDAPGRMARVPMADVDAQWVERYFRTELGQQTPLRYVGGLEAFSLEPLGERREVGRRWASQHTAAEDAERLQTALRLNPQLKVLDMCGYYDLGANCIGDQYLIDRASTPVRDRIRLARYRGGHAPYFAPEVRPQMRRDFAAFARDVVASQPGR